MFLCQIGLATAFIPIETIDSTVTSSIDDGIPIDFASHARRTSNTVCVNEPNWESFDPNGMFSGKTCSDIAELSEFWCDYMSEFPSINDTTSNEACCVCGGGNHVMTTPTDPSTSPSESPTQCVDEPNWYWDVENSYGCSTVTNSFCGDLDQRWYNGKNAMLACCECGGGKHVALAPSEIPSVSPTDSPSSKPSVLPSHIPSFQHSSYPSIAQSFLPTTETYEECNDIEGWVTNDPNEFWSGKTCSAIAELPSFWCTYLSNFTSLDMSSFEACCACGGGERHIETRSNQPSEFPTSAPTQCFDQPDWFWDKENEYSCDQVSLSFCDTLSFFWNDGKNVKLACCTCGGGFHIPYVPSSNPSAEPSVSHTPSKSELPSLEPSSLPSTKPSSQPSHSPTDAPSYLPTVRPSFLPSSKPSLQCFDFPSNWYDNEGPKFDCLWYEDKLNCEYYGDDYSRLDTTANQACCACGGGVTNSSPSQLPSLSSSAPSSSTQPSLTKEITFQQTEVPISPPYISLNITIKTNFIYFVVPSNPDELETYKNILQNAYSDFVPGSFIIVDVNFNPITTRRKLLFDSNTSNRNLQEIQFLNIVMNTLISCEMKSCDDEQSKIDHGISSVLNFAEVAINDGGYNQAIPVITLALGINMQLQIGSTFELFSSTRIFATDEEPTSNPTAQPSNAPSNQPSNDPSTQLPKPRFAVLSNQPSNTPSQHPSNIPSDLPSETPSHTPTKAPSEHPSKAPSKWPSNAPSHKPSNAPSNQPSNPPSHQPSNNPSSTPSSQPSNTPSQHPSNIPSDLPSETPSHTPTKAPSEHPSKAPSKWPSNAPSHKPSNAPSNQPSNPPSHQPSNNPSSTPSSQPSNTPSQHPSNIPSNLPSETPSHTPTKAPSEQPSNAPSKPSSNTPSETPSHTPTNTPSRKPSDAPSHQPSNAPSHKHSNAPSYAVTQPNHCVDTIGTFFVADRGDRDCNWAIMTFKKIDLRCSLPDVIDNCCWSCRCHDKTDVEFAIWGIGYRDCAWAVDTPDKIDVRCGVPEVEENCCATCHAASLVEVPSPPPTPIISAAPSIETSAPTSTISAAPSVNTNSGSQCTDTIGTFFVADRGDRDCNWAIKTFRKIDLRCSLPDIIDNCCWSCMCHDKTDVNFAIWGIGDRNCAWAVETPDKIDVRCGLPEVEENCCATCHAAQQ